MTQPRSALTLTAIAYVPAVLSMMTVGVLVPFIETLSRDLAASPAELGLAIALFSMPTAVLATIGGGLIDRYGVRASLLFSVATSALGSALASQAPSLLALDGAMLVSGLGFGGVCVTAPCLIIATLSDRARIRAMSFLSTFAPTGYAAGLLLAVPFTAAGHWRVALLAHAGVMVLTLIALALSVPRVRSAVSENRDSLRETLTRMLSVIREPRAIRLGIAVALPNAVSYGTSLAAPSYLARVHHLSIASSSATVAGAKIAAMIIGGLSMGYLLSRKVSASLLFGVMVGIGALAQTFLFLPASGITLATVALIVWLFSFGGMAGGAMTLLPTVVRDPARSGAASGLVNQLISLASFAAPSTWLALSSGIQYVLLASACLVVSFIALPAQVTPAQVSRRQSDAATGSPST
jgi:predicted MFS family arabinose efflux permease